MATITVRLEDEVRDALQLKASQEGVTLSEYVRDRLVDAVEPIREARQARSEYSPDTLGERERHTLALLHRILARVLPPDSNDVDGDAKYQLERAEVLERGYTYEYWTEFAGLRPELSSRDSQFVADVLDMFRITKYSMDQLERDGSKVDDGLRRSLTFQGFDHNDPLEGQMSGYVEFLVDDDRWEEQRDFVKGPNRGNSHGCRVDVYSRILSEYRQLKRSRPRRHEDDDYLLSLDDLKQIAAARVHPSHR